MSSINTNVAAMTALLTLTQTNNALTETQNRISTGFRVSDASDNAAYWSIATTMRSDQGALSTVQDALGLGAATVDVAYTGINSGIEVVDQIKSKLVAARQPGVDRNKIQSEITELQAQLRGIADSATFSGENWLSVDSGAASYNGNKSIVSSFSRVGATVTIGTITIDTTATELFDSDDQSGILDTQNTTTNGAVNYSIAGATDAFDISTLTDTANDLADLEEIIGVVDASISSMTDAATVLGAAKAGWASSRTSSRPDGRDQPRCGAAGRCGHERGVHHAAGAAGQAAAGRAGALHRQRLEPEHPPALPLIRTDLRSSDRPRSTRGRSFFAHL
jgi:flagellin